MDVAIPFLYNQLKHHRNFIKSFSNNFSANDPEIFRNSIKKIGGSVIDLYYGNLASSEITDQITTKLKTNQAFESQQYLNYIRSDEKLFRNVSLSDSSEWTLLYGKDPERYIHIHPARNSNHSVRIRAMALKTALAIKVFFRLEPRSNDFVDIVNKARVDILRESPVKDERNIGGIIKVLDLL